MAPQRGATLVSAAASLAVALIAVLAVAYGLTLVEHQLDSRTALHRALGINTAYAAEQTAPLLIRSHHMPITVEAGVIVNLTLGFKNLSGRAWEKGGASTAILERADPSGPSVFMAPNWSDTMRATFQNEQTITHGSLALFSASFQAPSTEGTYRDAFVLRTLDGEVLEGSLNEVEMMVTSSTSVVPSSSTPNGFATSVYGTGASQAAYAVGSDGVDPFFVAETIRYDEEPTIRIGIEYVEPKDNQWFPHVITSKSSFRVIEESGHEVLTAPANAQIAVDFKPSDNVYHIKLGTDWYTADEPLRFIPTTEGALMQLPYYTDKLRWEGNTADNIFRGILEVRYVPHTERLWAINELGLEDYLRGITETWD
ncbi:MAG: hypothetical protein ABIG71_00970, partial [Candidatus Uhrbacteria bacterium]